MIYLIVNAFHYVFNGFQNESHGFAIHLPDLEMNRMDLGHRIDFAIHRKDVAIHQWNCKSTHGCCMNRMDFAINLRIFALILLFIWHRQGEIFRPGI